MPPTGTGEGEFQQAAPPTPGQSVPDGAAPRTIQEELAAIVGEHVDRQVAKAPRKPTRSTVGRRASVESVGEADVDPALASAVAAAVEQALERLLPGLIGSSVAVAVHEALDTAIAQAVPEAIDRAVADIVAAVAPLLSPQSPDDAGPAVAGWAGRSLRAFRHGSRG